MKTKKQTTENRKAWGRIGGNKRSQNLSPERRTEIAREAGKALWRKIKNNMLTPK